MSQSDNNGLYRFSLLTGKHYPLFLLLIIVLLVTMGVMVIERRQRPATYQKLSNCRYQIHAIHKRVIPAVCYRQIYDNNIAATTTPRQVKDFRKTRLKQDVYYLKSRDVKLKR